ncbi:hypothetical protein BU202_01975 [Streptococcus cuniculi]|uniref:Uncharacterized protein n=2 Tax=Streptococcus cuniculi TaxID=1432788 RepID=A0A1Q8E9E4_9STRE|nr:hypothetical protein BU202_01975 [Streptococcus cuniculi]
MKKTIGLAVCFLLFTLGGCALMETKNSRPYIEKQVSNVEKVYPTENVYDLFDTFPSGFQLVYDKLSDKEGYRYSESVELFGDSSKKYLSGKYERSRKELASSIEEVLDTFSVEYTKDGLIRSDTKEKIAFPKEGFLFQNLTLDKSVLASQTVNNYSYNVNTESYFIRYSPFTYPQSNMRDETILMIMGDEPYDKHGFSRSVSLDDGNAVIIERIDEYSVLKNIPLWEKENE